MRESEFISSNKSRWKKTELGHQINADLFQDYNALSDDASYAQTYFKNRSIRVYLNQILAKTMLRMLNKRGSLDSSFGALWTVDIPKAMYHARRALLLAFVIFSFFTLIGFYSAYKDANFTNEILGNSYVTQTFKNIENGDPMAIYKSSPSHEMFLAIAYNNLRVGAFAFALGFLFGVGSMFMMLVNGVMLGTFFHLFYAKGLSAEFNLTVWMHGTFEICMLIIEAAAGFVLGLGLLNKSTYSSLQSFYRSSKNGILMLLATIPFTIFAAFIESYLTRLTELPDEIRATFIIICLVFTLFYFVFYPWLRFKNGAFEDTDRKVEFVPESKLEGLKYKRYKKALSEGLKAFKLNIGLHLKLMFAFLALFLVTVYFFNRPLLDMMVYQHKNQRMANNDYFEYFFNNLTFLGPNFKAVVGSLLFLGFGIILAFALYISLSKFIRAMDISIENHRGFKNFLPFFLSFMLLVVTLHFLPFWVFFLLSPLLFNLCIAALMEKPSVFLSNGFKLTFRWNNVIALFTSGLLLMVITLLLHSPFFWLLTQIVELFYVATDLTYGLFLSVIFMGLSVLVCYLYIVLYFVNSVPNYLLNKELEENIELSNAIDNITVNKQILGFEIE